MSGKTLVIIDPDETVASILKKSILGYDPTSIVHTFSVIDKVKQQPGADIFICDMAELSQAIAAEENPIPSSIFDHAQVVITTYGSSVEILPSDIRSRASVILKPIDQREVSALIENLIGPIDTDIIQQSSLTSEQYNFCHKKLIELKSLTSARCVLLSDSVGSIIDTIGNTGGVMFDLITSLLGGGLGTLQEAGKVIDNTGGFNLAYREGLKTDLYAVNIGRTLFLAVLVDRISNHARLGTVWYYAKQTVTEIDAFLRTKKATSTQNQVFQPTDSKLLSEELDKLSF